MPELDDSMREELEKYRARCFWWVHPTMAVASLSRETLIRELQTYGGRPGMMLAGRLNGQQPSVAQCP
jgi:hypothetical protein